MTTNKPQGTSCMTASNRASRAQTVLPRALHFLLGVHPLEEAAATELAAALRPLHYPARAIITPVGTVQRDLYFVAEGTQMSVSFDQGGREHVMAFTYPPSVSGVPDSFLRQRPSQYELRALSPSRLYALGFEATQSLLDRHRCFERLYRKLEEEVMLGLIEGRRLRQTLNMEERFRDFAARSPHLFQLAAHKHLASYLEIDPTNFSKLYNRIRIELGSKDPYAG